MSPERIDKAIEIIDYAIKNQISVKEASVRCGKANTYVKNVKMLVYEKYNEGTLSDDHFNKFAEAYKKYEQQSETEAEGSAKFSYKCIAGVTSIDNVIFTKTDVPLPVTTIIDERTKFTEDENSNEATVEWNWGDNYPPDHVKTLDGLLEATKVDLGLWKVKEYTVNKWDTTSWKSGKPTTVQNWQVKARLIKQKEDIREREIGEYFRDMVRNYNPPTFSLAPNKKESLNENNLLEVSIFDLHIGKLAWGGETFENYDVKIARERFLNAVETLLNRASGFNYNRILFPIGNDFFNSDTIFNTTTKGTHQDEDLRWQKTFNIGVRLIVDAINMLKQTGAPVDVVVIPGNHDYERSFYMGKYLEAWFKSDSMVKINAGASPRKYYRFGKVLLGLTHGSEERESSLPLIMASDHESKPHWSETLYHEWHLGHIHRKRNVSYSVLDKSKSLSEDLGVTIRYLSSLSGTEEWHHRKGFIGCTKAADAFIWNDELGLIAHLNSNLVL